MKKSLIALAVLAASGAAMAQSSVTLFGVVDANYAYGSGNVANKSQLTNSGMTSSRLGFRGVEDLGGGLKGTFWLEAGLNNDEGTGAATGGGLSFNRRSLVGLEGGFGKVELGREYTPHFWNHTMYDPFGTNGAGTSQALNTTAGGATTVRSNNVVNYVTPAFSGFTAQVQMGLGEQVSNIANSKTGNMTSARLAYNQGALSLAVASGKTNKTAGVDTTSTNYGASYDLGVAKLMAAVTEDKDTGAANAQKGYVAGLTAPVGAGTVRFAVSESKAGAAKAAKVAAGYVHSLSKRTDLYATYAQTKYSGGLGAADTLASANGKLNVVEAGVKHSF